MIKTLKNVKKIRLYTTSAKNKMRACDVRKVTGATVVVNCTLFDWGTWKPVCPVKQNGKMLSTSSDRYRGLAWNNDSTDFTVELSTQLSKWGNFISCVFLIYKGSKCDLYPSPDVARPACRTGIFKTKNGKTHIWCDKQRIFTPWEFRNFLAERGDVDWALMLDGGGSTQLSQEGNEYVYQPRKVQNYLCIWEDTDAPSADSHYTPCIHAYSKSVDGDKNVAPNFKVREFACADGSDPVFIAEMLPIVLQKIRDHFGVAFRPNSCYRTPTYNKRVGGQPQSQHLYGLAADITVPGHTPDEVAQYARKLMPNFGGIGVYPSKNFVHIDVRQHVANWRS